MTDFTLESLRANALFRYICKECGEKTKQKPSRCSCGGSIRMLYDEELMADAAEGLKCGEGSQNSTSFDPKTIKNFLKGI